jgi:DNA-damage-inducible protein D
LGLSDIKERKGIPASEDLLDCAGRAELAANEFRITQTEQKLVRENIRDEAVAIRAHSDVGREVRRAIEKINGTPPENLKAEPNLKRLASEKRRRLKKGNLLLE